MGDELMFRKLTDDELNILLQHVKTERRARIVLGTPDDTEPRLELLEVALTELQERRRAERDQTDQGS